MTRRDYSPPRYGGGNKHTRVAKTVAKLVCGSLAAYVMCLVLLAMIVNAMMGCYNEGQSDYCITIPQLFGVF